MALFERDETFVSRKDILESIDENLKAVRSRAVLTGMGCVGNDQIFASKPCFGCDLRAPTLQLGKDQLCRTGQVLDR